MRQPEHRHQLQHFRADHAASDNHYRTADDHHQRQHRFLTLTTVTAVIDRRYSAEVFRISENYLARLTMTYGRVNLFVMVLAFVIATTPLSAQSRNRPNAPSKPAPHFPDGTPNLGI